MDQASLPTAAELEHNVRHFLGYYMIKKFDVLNFLEDTGERLGPSGSEHSPTVSPGDLTAVDKPRCAHAGIYVEGLDAGDDDAQRVQRKWQKPIYTAAPTVVYRC